MLPKLIENGGCFEDERGKIWTTHNSQDKKLNHVKATTNKKNTFRGFHGDSKTEKFTSCLVGKMNIYIICPKNLNSWEFQLDAKDALTLYIPKDFYHGYHSVSDSIYLYQLCYEGEYVDKEEQKTLLLEDSCIAEETKKTLLNDNGLIRSKRDSKI